MYKLVTSEQIRKHESEWIQKINSNWSLTLMEKAGSGLAETLLEYSEPFLFVCGKGNNGGDGLVAARYLHNLGKKVFLFFTSNESELSKDAKTNLTLIKDKIPCSKIQEQGDNDFIRALNNANTIVDCILGIGSSKTLSPFFEWIVKTINSSNKTIISCDIPTGINPDNGNVPSKAIKAKITVTFGYPKLGLVIYPAKKYSGTVKIVDIGLPNIDTNIFLIDDSFVKENLPKRPEDANKGSFGRTFLVAGSKKYPGAALLSAKAASTIGSGLTMMASPQEVFNQITPVTPEVIHVDFTLKSILEESLKSNVMVVGPGLTIEKDIIDLVESIISSVNVPIVLDADGINAFAERKDFLQKAKNHIILTPHQKEFARFLGISVDELLKNKVNIVQDVAGELGCTIVLKGPATIIASKSREIYVSPFANAALAKGGTGDVLAGFIGGLIAQGLNPKIAACTAVYLHGKTAELVAQDKTVFSLLPQDLISHLPLALKLYI